MVTSVSVRPRGRVMIAMNATLSCRRAGHDCGNYFPDGGAGGGLTQLGAGGVVRAASAVLLCALTSTPTTRMSPAGMPDTLTVVWPSLELRDVMAIELLWLGRTAGGGSEWTDGHPGRTGTTTTRSPSR